VLIWYDICHKRPFDRKSLVLFSGLGLIALWFARLTISAEAASSPKEPYYMDLTALTFGRGYGWYFDRLYDMRLRWGAWMSICVVLFAWMLYKREHRGIFFLGYIFLTLLPVVLLVNHRGEFYWYIPFFGFAGLVAVTVDAIARRLERWNRAAMSTL